MQELLEQYRATLRDVRRALERTAEPGERSILSGMVRDLEWTIIYLRTGYPPEMHRGRYGCVVPVDPVTLDSVLVEGVRSLADEFVDRGLDERPAMTSALWSYLNRLTPRELEAFLLVLGEGFSEREAARLLGVSRRTVRTLVQRSWKKLVAHPLAI